MAKVPRVRFCATIYPGLVKLVSVTEKNDGTLIINLNAPPYYEKEFLKQSIGKEHRYTVHPSENSKGHTITQTVGFDDGHINRSAMFVLRKNERFIAHIFSSRWAYLGAPCFLLKKGHGDKIINLCTFNENLSTLITHVFVCTKGIGEKIRIDAGGECFSFGKFDLVVIPYFLKSMPMPDGDTAYWLSSPEGQSAPTDLSQRQPLESLEIIHVKMAIQEMNNRLKNYLKDRIRNLIKFNDNEEQIELLNDHLMGNYGFLQESPFPFIPAKL